MQFIHLSLDKYLPRSVRPVLAGLSAYASAEMITRVVRIGAILVIARRTDPALLGTAAAALSLFELIRVLANAGIGQRIIAASDAELPAICNTAARLFWAICLSVSIIQLTIAGGLYLFTVQDEAALMLAVLSAVYLIMPPGLVQIFLLMRAGRLGATARIGATQTMADHIFTVGLVLIWPTAWAIVLPKLLTAPIWTVLARRAQPWSPDRSAGYAPVRHFHGFGFAILGSELLGALRLQADKLIIAALLGVEALGLYYFAFNAGLGITQSFTSAFGTVVFPHLCRAGDEQERQARLREASSLGLLFLVPLIAAQGLLAPFYVPFLFGNEWTPAAPYLSLLCLAALPLFCGSALSAAYRADQRPGRETRLAAIATAAGLAGLTVGATYSLTLACAGYSAGLAITLIPAALKRVLPTSPIHTAKEATS
ncbi:oligosaccharide flippase family protein [Altericroceibacterium endophyticum]|uniref:Oligosaccharide flippase family protein n=1 Tax=Altericroceibacterium endophyticum TaxID=1808508 RepID=A0A6I4T899_9SPHN|nr:oligosaccharide flippase family protein [Altericroceibacterium endophyticum]MXO66341.1 oligosaccharide flippase family protein [Altericroceibacterium endophyticum]